MAHDVFISYAVQDATPAHVICAALESNDIRCWIQPRDLPTGSNHADCIMQAIRDSKAILLVFSRHAEASGNVPREVNEAINLRIPLIPVRIANVPLGNAMKYLLSLAQWLDVFDRPLDHYMEQIVANTRSVLMGQGIVPVTRTFWMRWRSVVMGAAAVVAVALLAAYLVAPKPLGTTAALSGRWQMDGSDCVLSVGFGSTSQVDYHFSGECRDSVLAGMKQSILRQKCGPIERPSWKKECIVTQSGYMSKSKGYGRITLAPNSIIDQDAFRKGDDGTFRIEMDVGDTITGSFRTTSNGFPGFGRRSLVFHSDGLPTGTWQQISKHE